MAAVKAVFGWRACCAVWSPVHVSLPQMFYQKPEQAEMQSKCVGTANLKLKTVFIKDINQSL